MFPILFLRRERSRVAALLLCLAAAHAARAEELSITPQDALLRASAVISEETTELPSAQVMGRFECRSTESGHDQVKVQAKGQFIGIYSDGKCRIDFEFETRRRMARTRNAAGVISMALVDQDADRTSVISGGGVAHVYEYTGFRHLASAVHTA